MAGVLALIGLLILDTSISWLRMLAALFISILLGLAIGIIANVSDRAEQIIIPVLDIFQTLPILAFFPFVIYIFVALLPGYIGINAAVIFLIVTSMVWNIAFGVYESIKSMPVEFHDVAGIFHLSPLEKLRKVYIPASMPRVVDQSMLSWAIGLFYLVTSEIFSVGIKNYTVAYGIGVELTKLATTTGGTFGYIIGIAVFIIFVIATRFILFGYLERKFVKRTGHARPNLLSRLLIRQKLVGEVSKDVLRVEKSVENRVRPQLAHEQGSAHQKIIEGKSRIPAKRGPWIMYAVALVAIAIVAGVLLGSSSIRGEEYQVLVAMGLSLARIWLAFAVILAVAFPVGVYLVFMSKRSSEYMLLFQIIASIPATILLPIIAVSLSGSSFSGELVAFVVFFLSGIWYMIFGIVSNRASIQQSILEVKRIAGVKGGKAWKYIYSKAVLPGLITGGITAIAAEWNASIVAERFTTTGAVGTTVVTSVGNGLGKLLDLALGSGNLQLMLIGLINLTVVIIIINRLVWKRAYRSVMKVYR